MEKQVGSQPVVASSECHSGQWQFFFFFFFCASVHTQTFNVKTRLCPYTHKKHTQAHTPCMHISTHIELNHTRNSGWFQGQYGELPSGLFFNPTSLNRATLMRLTNLQALWSTTISPSHDEEKLITAPAWKIK